MENLILSIQTDGRKDILGIWISENESSKLWLQVMNDLKNRGIKDVYMFCEDGLKGVPGGDKRGVSEVIDSALYYPSDPLINKVCELQGYEATDGRPEENISGGERG